MTTKEIEKTIGALKRKNVEFEPPLSSSEIEQIESKFKIRFPKDLRSFYQMAFPVSDSFVNWRLGLQSEAVAEKILSRCDWPWEGMAFDIDKNAFWRKEWGPKPEGLEAQLHLAKDYYKRYPKLIPIYSHRYIPEVPHGAGNPVFSVYQMDIIYYGKDLKAYFANEFNFNGSGDYELNEYPTKKIDFWSSIAEDDHIYN